MRGGIVGRLGSGENMGGGMALGEGIDILILLLVRPRVRASEYASSVSVYARGRVSYAGPSPGYASGKEYGNGRSFSLSSALSPYVRTAGTGGCSLVSQPYRFGALEGAGVRTCAGAAGAVRRPASYRRSAGAD
jgi:hypothetical protein